MVAVVLFGMPVGPGPQRRRSTVPLFGFFPILWIVINAVWVYNLTVASGHFDVLRRSFEKVSPDQRIQAIIIAFCFGALLEALAGFGTPVAISVVMLMALGFKPVKAATVALVANTAPVAFGALAIPIVTLAPIASGVSNDPRLSDANALTPSGRWSAGRRRSWRCSCRSSWCSIVDGRRGVRQTWLPALVARRASFGVAQFVTVQLHLRAAHRHRRLAGRRPAPWCCWCGSGSRPRCSTAEPAERARRASHARAASRAVRRRRRATGSAARPGDGAARTARPAAAGRPSVDNRAEVLRAYAPYLVIIAIFSITNIPAVEDFLAKEPWTYLFDWPGLDVAQRRGRPGASTRSSSTGCPPPAPCWSSPA